MDRLDGVISSSGQKQKIPGLRKPEDQGSCSYDDVGRRVRTRLNERPTWEDDFKKTWERLARVAAVPGVHFGDSAFGEIRRDIRLIRRRSCLRVGAPRSPLFCKSTRQDEGTRRFIRDHIAPQMLRAMSGAAVRNI